MTHTHVFRATAPGILTCVICGLSRELPTVAALYVDPRGPYPKMLGVDCWDEKRDARLYDGPHPIVAHPPCGRWCKLAALVEARYGYKVGEDGGVFARALEQVRMWGGVLEHPAESKAWSKFGLTPPARGGWTKTLDGEWVCEVAQSAYGHRARKRTWLLFVGAAPVAARWEQPRGQVIISGAQNRCARPLSERMWRAEARRTPPLFADYLVRLAQTVIGGARADAAGPCSADPSAARALELSETAPPRSRRASPGAHTGRDCLDVPARREPSGRGPMESELAAGWSACGAAEHDLDHSEELNDSEGFGSATKSALATCHAHCRLTAAGVSR